MAARKRRKKIEAEPKAEENKIVLEEPKEDQGADVGADEIKAKVEEKIEDQVKIEEEPKAKKKPNPADSREYPAYRYHKEHGMRLVNNAAEERALGSGWRHTPQDF